MFTSSDGLSGDYVNVIFEDREGNVWVATNGGLDRFREFAVTTFTRKQGLSDALVASVLADKERDIWLSTFGGLDRRHNREIVSYEKPGGSLNRLGGGLLFQDRVGRIWFFALRGTRYLQNDHFIPINAVPAGVVHSVAEDASGDLWIAHQDVGLIRLHDGKAVQQIPWAGLGRKDLAMTIAADPANGGLWLGFLNGGIGYFADGTIRKSYTVADGMGEGQVNSLRFDRNGILWAATEGGLSRLKGGHFATLSSRNGLPCDAVHWAIEDNDHSLWLYMPCGLVRIARDEVDAWTAAADKNQDSKQKIQFTLFDSSDGVRTIPTIALDAQVAKSPDGKLWFSPWDGVSEIDPHHLPVNKTPPPVEIEQIIADGKTYDAANGLRLPPHLRDLTIDYTALSLVAPEKIHFRYKLDGQDPAWREVVNDRRAEYSNLAPRHYTFRVMACNNSGVWNEAGATLDFVIPPAWYQTNWFRAACVVAFLMMFWGMYELRVRHLAAQFNMRLDERVNERTRIARELHDTLLQNFQGLLPRLQAAIYMLPERGTEARKTLEAAVDKASEAITEGRDAVKGMRLSTVEKNDLAVAVRTLGEELAVAGVNQSSPTFEVAVQGTPRSLHPILRDEVYRLVAEALRNAFRHAEARKIEVEIRYGEKEFRLQVRDNGRGIDPSVLSGDGREGHYGLHGMHERAKIVGGKLKVWSELDSGTEVELSIPALRAYSQPPRRLQLFQKLSGRDKQRQEKV
jgi:signal transduction histidine kinase